MKNKYLIVFVSLLLIVSLVLVSVLIWQDNGLNRLSNGNAPSVFVGIDVAYNNLVDMEKLVDQVSSYANLLIIGSTGITYTSQLSDACQYIYDRGLYFILYTESAPPLQWLQNATNKWGTHFLGLYPFDEIGGKQLDQYQDWVLVHQAANYSDAANQYENVLNQTVLGRIKRNYNSSTKVPLFTSDYALYWFDYKGGYNTIFAEFGWNYSRQLNVALCRGAAKSQNKTWGVMITYTYTNPPYIESAPDLYNDMILAYSNGAKYIAVFDSNPNWTQGILDQEHLTAIKQFWQYMNDNPRADSSIALYTAYVLPEDYAYGFRGPNDKIWGLWGADNLTITIATQLYSLMQQYGTKLDVIYADGSVNYASHYSELIFWNGTTFSR